MEKYSKKHAGDLQITLVFPLTFPLSGANVNSLATSDASREMSNFILLGDFLYD